MLTSSITALLGITFEETNRKILIFLISLVAAYVLIAFVLYAIPDYLRANMARRTATRYVPRDVVASAGDH